MRYLLLAAASAVVLGVHATPSFADRAAADACAARLPADAKLIYGAVIGSVAPGVNLVDTVKLKTRSLVMAGKIQQAEAQTAAQAAGACLKQAL
jgi:hypothetical protein